MTEKNPPKHELVPSHEKISAEEKQNLLSSMNISFKNLPKIYRDDPAIKEMDVKIGDIIKVARRSSTAKETIFYRGVVDA